MHLHAGKLVHIPRIYMTHDECPEYTGLYPVHGLPDHEAIFFR